MTLREALRNKKKSVIDMNHQISAWDIYGEATLVLICAHWEPNAENLHKLLDYLSFADKLIIALPEETSPNRIFEVANLEVVDGILTYSDAQELMKQIPLAKFAIDGITLSGLSADLKARMAAL
jgi:hypothetical protein